MVQVLASPNACSVIALSILNLIEVLIRQMFISWLDRYGSVEIDLYDDEDVDSSYYWSQANDSGWVLHLDSVETTRGNSSLEVLLKGSQKSICN